QQRQRLEVIEGGDNDLDLGSLEFTGQRIKSGGLVVERLAHHHLFFLGLELLGGPIGQPLPVRCAIDQRGVTRSAQLGGRERTNRPRLQSVVGHHAEGGGKAHLRELGVGGNG